MEKDSGSKGKEGAPSFSRRNHLLSIEKEVQEQWERGRVFEEDAPNDDTHPKFFVTFPYPYMNGRLHIGHAFSLSKAEFGVGYERMKGKRALFPFAFHCTGMPIKACADKLKREIELYGCPPVFPPSEEEGTQAQSPEDQTANPTAFHTKKSKVASKKAASWQWESLEAMGIPPEEIPHFTNPAFWLHYFPPIGMSDLKKMGLHVDWRRSFITTEINPYYDSFVKWQFSLLRKKGKVVFGTRPTIYSIKDKQPCADHDRSSGEGVLPQEYTLIKMELQHPYPPVLKELEHKKVILPAATLRPETMYGQTNFWVLPDGTYGVYEVNDKEVFVCSPRSALNMAYQQLSRIPNQVCKIMDVKGCDLLGACVTSPLCKYDVIYGLPLLTISMVKGTGIVTSVPSDSPDDYAALRDLKQKPPLRAKFHIKDEWVLPFDIVSIIHVPELGNVAAEKVCIDMDVKSQNDRENLTKAHDLVYKLGFYNGVLTVGPHAGKKVQDAKNLIKDALVAEKRAVVYSEPERVVISRSGDECIVAMCDQWFLQYGEEGWRDPILGHVRDTLATYHEETRNQLRATLEWLGQWACSRQFGLGSRLPWDKDVLIESLSDSTIYMAYYTISHLLQQGSLDGHVVGPAGIRPEQLTNEVWDYIFLEEAYPVGCTIPEETLQKLRKEFRFWYPFDLRVSGKDLIQNHLTMCLYNHAAIFPEHFWPRGIRANGHIMLNNEKMAKSTGNFLTLHDGIQQFAADPTRLALADAGDGTDDANFVVDTANMAILRLTTQIEWYKETMEQLGANSLRTGDFNFFDRVFNNQIHDTIRRTDEAYAKTFYRDALHAGFFDFQNARDDYRVATGEEGMHRDLAVRFMEVQALLLAPLCPHFAEYVWGRILGKEGSILCAPFPSSEVPDLNILRANEYLKGILSDMRSALLKPQKKKKKGKEPDVPPDSVAIYIALEWPHWQKYILDILSGAFNRDTKTFAPDLMDQIRVTYKAPEGAPKERVAELKRQMTQAMQFAAFMRDDVAKRGEHALDRVMPFSEKDLLMENREFIQRQLGTVKTVYVYASDDVDVPDPERKLVTAAPGKPQFRFFVSTSVVGARC